MKLKPEKNDVRSRALDLATLPEENPSPVLRVDPVGGVLYTNSATRKMLGIVSGAQLTDELASDVAEAWRSGIPVKHQVSVAENIYLLTIVAVSDEGYLNLYGRDITDEVAARQSADDLARFPNENPNPVMRISLDGAVLFANRPARDIDGLIDRHDKLISCELADAVRDAASDNVTRLVEIDFRGRCFAFFLTPIQQRGYINVYARDITAERKAQLETRSLAKFPEENPNPVLRVQRDGKVLFANNSARKLDHLLTKSGSALNSSMSMVVDEAFRLSQHRLFEFYDGERLYAFVITVVEGESYVNVYGRDITEERRANLEVLRIKNFNQGILDNLTNGIATLDNSLRITSANPAIERILGLEVGRVEGRGIAEVVGEANGWIVDTARTAVEGDDPVTLLDREFIGSDQRRTSVNLTAVPFKATEPGYSGTLLVFEDITKEMRMKGTMVRFMSDTVVQRLLDAGDAVLSGTTQEVSILFSDIREFTSLSERIGASDMVSILNAYFSDMVDVVFENNGTLDKFIGDAIMAVFGAPFQSPDDADNAVSAAIEMMRRLKLFNEAGKASGMPMIDIGVGIDTGPVIAGTIGSPKRMEYTVIGDHVNLAARIESINKLYGTHILISEFTKQRLKGDLLSREIDMVRVAGIEAPVRIYEVLAFHDEESFPNLEECLAAFALGLECYRAKAWREGADAFARALNFNPGDRPTQIFLSRCWGYLARAPQSDWAAVTDISK